MGKGLVGPSNLVAQTHFAIAENVGDVLAKEEVWLVVGELCGLGLGIGILVKERCCPTFFFSQRDHNQIVIQQRHAVLFSFMHN
jgi:hypothetical protein